MILFIENDPIAHACSFVPWLDEMGVSHRVIRAHAGEPLPPPDSPHPLIVLGGVMGVHDAPSYPFLVDELRLLRAAANGGAPLLGICLGGQLLAAALDGAVHPQSRSERGSIALTLTPEGAGDPLFAGIPHEFRALELHNDSFDLPPGAVHLAKSGACPFQAFRYGRWAYGLQFHPEVDVATFHRWLELAPLRQDERAALLEQAHDYYENWEQFHRQLLRNFLYLAGVPVR
jgi:GMP synthase-like glutamine amidotransferase